MKAAVLHAFDEKLTIAGVVTAVIKGGLSVDVGMRGFMPASRSGTSEQSMSSPTPPLEAISEADEVSPAAPGS